MNEMKNKKHHTMETIPKWPETMMPITLLVLCDDSMTVNCLFWTDTLLTDNKNVDI
jgi:hypothetical protein